MIQLNDVHAGYVPGVNILHGLSLQADLGEIVTIIGPNGSGKSTSLKAVSGQILARQGQVMVNGTDMSRLPIDRRVREGKLALVPQSENVFGALTIRENLDLGGAFLSKQSRKRRIEMLLDAYPVLRRKYHDKAYSMSGGERQILALARALMPEPYYLLLDEPSAGLSPMMLEEVFEAISDIVRRIGISVLLVEQNAAEALAISDRAYVLVMGKAVIEGRADAILNDEKVRALYLGGEDV